MTRERKLSGRYAGEIGVLLKPPMKETDKAVSYRGTLKRFKIVKKAIWKKSPNVF